MCGLQIKWETGVEAEGSWKPCQVIQHSCFWMEKWQANQFIMQNFLRCIICKHESNPSWSRYKSIFSLIREILKRRRIFSLQFLSWGQIAFSFSILIKTSVRKNSFGILMLYISCNSRCLDCKNLTFLLLCDLTDYFFFKLPPIFFHVTKRGN